MVCWISRLLQLFTIAGSFTLYTQATPLCSCTSLVTDTVFNLASIKSQHVIKEGISKDLDGSPIKTLFFRNPAGVDFKTVVMSQAENLDIAALGYSDSTWFDGYEWRIVSNPKCPPEERHMGWFFSRIHPADSQSQIPKDFFLLIYARLGSCEDSAHLVAWDNYMVSSTGNISRAMF